MRRRLRLPIAIAIALVAARAEAQEDEPARAPASTGVRIEGPLLSARSPSQLPSPPPPPASPGPFEVQDANARPAPFGESAADGPEPPIQGPLLEIPPVPPPMPAMPVSGPTAPDSAFGSTRSTQIRQPSGLFGELGRRYHEIFLWGDEPYEYLTLPSNLLWKIPLANQREPRFFGKFTNLKHKNYIDTAIGAQFGLGRIAPKGRPNEGIQLDLFGGVFTRFDPKRFLTAADYRAGIPLTYAKGPWSTKLSYEHTSTHIGDEYSQAYGRRQVPLVLDEIVSGVSRYFGEHIRVYGQSGYAFNTAKETNANNRTRFDFGFSYSNYEDTGPQGRPYLAFDMDLRSYQGFRPNDTFQAGWQWVNHGRSARLGVEVYNGKSPYGQFYKDDEHWVGVAGYYDW